MTPEEKEEKKLIVEALVRGLGERIAPQLNECGVLGFVLFAYMEDGAGKIHKVSLGGFGKDANPAYQDGLRPVEVMATAWAAGHL